MKRSSKVGMLEYLKGIQAPLEQVMLIIKHTLNIRGPVGDDGFSNWYIVIHSLTVGATSYLKLDLILTIPPYLITTLMTDESPQNYSKNQLVRGS